MNNNENKKIVGKIDIYEALKLCDGSMSCGFCKYCADKAQDQFVVRKDGAKSYWPWSGKCHRYPPTVVVKNSEFVSVHPRVYLTDSCGEFASVEKSN